MSHITATEHDRIRERFNDEGIGEFGLHDGRGEHPLWQSLSAATEGFANAVSRRPGHTETPLETAQRYVNGKPAFREWLATNGLADPETPETPETPTHTPISELKEGDVVTLTGSGWGDRAGQERVIRVITDDLSTARFVGGGYANNDDWQVTLKSRPEAASREVPEGLTFARYHESMFPMIETLSKAADDAGYCAEYDRMARSIGAPTRAEVRTLVRERDGGRYRVYIPVTVRIPVDVTAANEDEARTAANEARLPGTDAIGDGWRASAQSWEGLDAAIRHELETNGRRNLHFDGIGSYIVSEL